MSAENNDRMSWFREAKFGVFFHWGVAAVYGHGQWALYQERTPLSEYEKLAGRFNPKPGWANRWMKLVRNAGARYAVLTAKHHDGYCLFDTKTSDFNSVKTGPGRDLICEYINACRKAGIRVGIYYSPPDWRFTWDPSGIKPGDKCYEEYYNYIHTQIRELCTNYGNIDLWWWDGVPPDTKKTVSWMRKTQPDMIINDRCGLKLDCASSEKEIKKPDCPSPAWEVCHTSNKHWGYFADEKNCQWMSLAESIHWLVSIALTGGNLLYNIGPKANGDIPAKAEKLFSGIGDWLKKNRESITGCSGSSITGGSGGATGARGTTTYLHVLHYTYPDVIFLSPEVKVQSARILLTGRSLKITQEGERVILTDMPKKTPDASDTVIVLKTDKSSEV